MPGQTLGITYWSNGEDHVQDRESLGLPGLKQVRRNKVLSNNLQQTTKGRVIAYQLGNMLSVLRKARLKDKEMRILMLYDLDL